LGAQAESKTAERNIETIRTEKRGKVFTEKKDGCIFTPINHDYFFMVTSAKEIKLMPLANKILKTSVN